MASEPTITHGVVSAVSISSSDMAKAAVRALSSRARRQPASSSRSVSPATCRSSYEMSYFSWKLLNRVVRALVAQ